jgi:hypothetical protein
MSLNLRHWLAERQIELAQLGHSHVQVAGVAFRIVQDMEVKSLTPFDISPLAEVLELPLTAAWQAAEPLSLLSVGLLRLLSRKKPLKRNEGTWLTFQIAYINALQGILEQESRLRRPWLDRARVPTAAEGNEPLIDPSLPGLLKTLRPGRLSDSQAEQALSQMGESFFVQQMNSISMAWFVANGAEDTEAKLLTQRLVYGLPGYLLEVIAENALPLAQLQKFVRLGNLVHWGDSPETDDFPESLGSSPTTLPIDLHRERYRATLLKKLSEPLLTEHFALKDLYVPLKGVAVREESVSSPASTVDLSDWVMSQLQDLETIAVIEAESGYGKTSFCKIWAAQVAQELYPRWMPVLIHLRDVTLKQTLEQTLETAFPQGRFTDAEGWLSPIHPPCLLIIDGLDELPCLPQAERSLGTFMAQVMRFYHQRRGATHRYRHKLILTGTPETIDWLTRKYQQDGNLLLASLGGQNIVPLQRIVIQPFGQEEFRQWFIQWAKLQSKSIAQMYFSFLKQGGVFRLASKVQDLANLLCQPLQLYLLGVLHRDGLIDERIFELPYPQVKFEIYDRICRWLLGEPLRKSGVMPELVREGLAHACRSPEVIAHILQGKNPQEVRYLMQMTALTLLQTGQHQVAVSKVTALLTKAGLLEREFPEQTQEKISKDQNLENRLPALFFRCNFSTQVSSSEANIEFSHSILGGYLAAEAIASQLKSLTQQVQDRYGDVTFAIQSAKEVAQHLYALLGYGVLSKEVEELVIERLRREQTRNVSKFSFAVLFERLEHFYRAYCRSRWLDEEVAHQVHAELQGLHNPLTVLQVDAAVGLNVFLLLCAIAQAYATSAIEPEASLAFWPCGNPSLPQEFEPERLLTLMSHTAVLSPTAFWQRSRQSLMLLQLSGAYLNQVMLAEANLWLVNFSAAELMGANLAGANLQEANLSWANLTGANLSKANLSGAKLEGANLSGANLLEAKLNLANLNHTCLYNAQLEADLANLARDNGAIFSLEEFYEYKQSLPRSPQDILEQTRAQPESTVFLIESAEGEPVFPDYFDDEYSRNETIASSQASQIQSAFPNAFNEYEGGSETIAIDNSL